MNTFVRKTWDPREVHRLSRGRRFTDGEAMDRILAGQPRRRVDDRIADHRAGAHTALGTGPHPDCPLCGVTSMEKAAAFLTS